MTDSMVSATALGLGTAAAVLTVYLVCKRRIDETRNRILVLEREIALARIREETNEKKLANIFEAVVELRETVESQLGQLHEKLDKLLAENFLQVDRSAA
jgi:Tfp pilus assembly protein PilN